MADRGEELLQQVRYAVEHADPLQIVGNGSKVFMGREPAGKVISTAGHSGLIEYEPTELVITVRSGTTLAEVDDVLGAEGQWLGCEPPWFAADSGGATVGGTLACNQSGPARPWLGSIRDHVLGLRLINGRAEQLHFGGRVMKNVAGYDVSRLQAGAMGTLGLITEVSLRVFPRPECQGTAVLECDAAAAIARMSRESLAGGALSAATWVDGRLFLRYSGSETVVRERLTSAGGERLAAAESFWTSIREQRHDFFTADEVLWRLSVPPAAPLPEDGRWLIDWSGAQRWLHGPHRLGALEETAERVGGQAALYRGGDRSGEVFHRRTVAQRRIHLSLKRAFDPQGVFNPGRLFSWM